MRNFILQYEQLNTEPRYLSDSLTKALHQLNADDFNPIWRVVIPI